MARRRRCADGSLTGVRRPSRALDHHSNRTRSLCVIEFVVRIEVRTAQGEEQLSRAQTTGIGADAGEAQVFASQVPVDGGSGFG